MAPTNCHFTVPSLYWSIDGCEGCQLCDVSGLLSFYGWDGWKAFISPEDNLHHIDFNPADHQKEASENDSKPSPRFS
ncbi:hypothetical protein [Mesobacillus maritimus]|uniref:hypothetical protein n=1 Tax=Mesobacillus maritimus TaxID=1643336 RepID=UPI00384DBDFD